MKTERPTDSNILLKAMATEMKESGTYNFIWPDWNNEKPRSTATFEAGFANIIQNWYKEVKKEYRNKFSDLKKNIDI